MLGQIARRHAQRIVAVHRAARECHIGRRASSDRGRRSLREGTRATPPWSVPAALATALGEAAVVEVAVVMDVEVVVEAEALNGAPSTVATTNGRATRTARRSPGRSIKGGRVRSPGSRLPAETKRVRQHGGRLPWPWVAVDDVEGDLGVVLLVARGRGMIEWWMVNTEAIASMAPAAASPWPVTPLVEVTRVRVPQRLC